MKSWLILPALLVLGVAASAQEPTPAKEATAITPAPGQLKPEPVSVKEAAKARAVQTLEPAPRLAPDLQPEEMTDQPSEDQSPEPPPPARPLPPRQTGGMNLLDRSLPAPAEMAQGASNSGAPEPGHEPDEVMILSGSMDEAKNLARTLASQGIRIKSRRALGELGLVISVMRLSPGTDVFATLARLRQQYPDLIVDANQHYQLQSLNRKRYAHQRIAWPGPVAGCLRSVTVGVLDTGVETSHPALQGRGVETESFIGRRTPAPTDHGTAVAALLQGGVEQPDFTGLIPETSLWVANVFRAQDQGPVTTTDYLVAGLDWLVGKPLGVINLSLGGARNLILERVLIQVLERGILVVAAAGNNGPDSGPVYPAAQPGVIAVSAVDAADQLYREASTGDYVDLVAPGVDLWVANARGEGSYRSGTSYATPFVTAFLAHQLAVLPKGTQVDLARHTQDLGPEGRDPKFGWGLLQWPACEGAALLE